MASEIRTLKDKDTQVLPRTTAQAVSYNGGISQLKAITVQTAIDEIAENMNNIAAGDFTKQIQIHNESEEAHLVLKNQISTHEKNISNPHRVTAAQVGADPTGSANEALTQAKQYTDEKFQSISTPDVSGQINTHNSDPSSHSDIRAHASLKTNPHAVTAAQVGAIPTTGGTINGNLNITGALSINGSSISQVPLLTKTFSTTSDTSSIDIGPFSQIPKYLLVLMGSLQGGYSDDSGIKTFGLGTITCTTVNSECVGSYSGSQANKIIGGSGPIGTLIQSGSQYYIRCTRDAFLGNMLFYNRYFRFECIAFF